MITTCKDPYIQEGNKQIFVGAEKPNCVCVCVCVCVEVWYTPFSKRFIHLGTKTRFLRAQENCLCFVFDIRVFATCKLSKFTLLTLQRNCRKTQPQKGVKVDYRN